jgi:integrase
LETQKGGETVKSRYLSKPIFNALLLLLMPENAEALRLSLDYGMRIGDVLRIPTSAMQAGHWSFKEQKTGKRRRVKFSRFHQEVTLAFAGKIYVFEHRTDPNRHRTRQAVYKDITGLARRLGYMGISPHSARKIYAVDAYKRCHDLDKVKRLLNHSDPSVTALYALADQMEKANPRRC